MSIGAGYAFGSVTIDIAYLYARRNRTISDSQTDDLTPDQNALNGVYKTEAHEACATVSNKF